MLIDPSLLILHVLARHATMKVGHQLSLCHEGRQQTLRNQSTLFKRDDRTYALFLQWSMRHASPQCPSQRTNAYLKHGYHHKLRKGL